MRASRRAWPHCIAHLVAIAHIAHPPPTHPTARAHAHAGLPSSALLCLLGALADYLDTPQGLGPAAAAQWAHHGGARATLRVLRVGPPAPDPMAEGSEWEGVGEEGGPTRGGTGGA